jgi:hypothetical protein
MIVDTRKPSLPTNMGTKIDQEHLYAGIHLAGWQVSWVRFRRMADVVGGHHRSSGRGRGPLIIRQNGGWPPAVLFGTHNALRVVGNYRSGQR